MVESLFLVGRGSRTTGDWTGAVDGFFAKDVDTPKHAPSRGRVLGHGSARFQAYRAYRTKILNGSGQIVRTFGSLAPPKKKPRPIS
jgi:hypothetical protein